MCRKLDIVGAEWVMVGQVVVAKGDGGSAKAGDRFAGLVGTAGARVQIGASEVLVGAAKEVGRAGDVVVDSLGSAAAEGVVGIVAVAVVGIEY